MNLGVYLYWLCYFQMQALVVYIELWTKNRRWFSVKIFNVVALKKFNWFIINLYMKSH